MLVLEQPIPQLLQTFTPSPTHSLPRALCFMDSRVREPFKIFQSPPDVDLPSTFAFRSMALFHSLRKGLFRQKGRSIFLMGDIHPMGPPEEIQIYSIGNMVTPRIFPFVGCSKSCRTVPFADENIT